MTAPQTNEIRNGLRFRNAALCAAFGALSAMSFIVSGENYQGISDPPASSASPPITPAKFLSEFRTLMTGNAIVWAV